MIDSDRYSPLPKWIPKHFKDLIHNNSCVKYNDMMLKLTATDLRIIIKGLGEKVVKKIRVGDLSPDKNVKRTINQLLDYYIDPINNERNILKLMNKLNHKYKIQFNQNRR